jgi:hypothetical protein
MKYMFLLLILFNMCTSGMDPKRRNDLWSLTTNLDNKGEIQFIKSNYWERAAWQAEQSALRSQQEVIELRREVEGISAQLALLKESTAQFDCVQELRTPSEIKTNHIKYIHKDPVTGDVFVTWDVKDILTSGKKAKRERLFVYRHKK